MMIQETKGRFGFHLIGGEGGGAVRMSFAHRMSTSSST